MAQKTKAKTSKTVAKPKIQVGSGTLQKPKSKRGFQLNQRVVLIAFAALFGLVGVYMLFRSRAGTVPEGSIFAGSFVVDAGGVETTPQRYPDGVESTPTGLRNAVPTMSFDGRKIAYFDQREGKIRIIDSSTAQQTNEYTPSVNRGIQKVTYMQWDRSATKLAVQYQVSEGIMRAFVMEVGKDRAVDLPDAWNVALAGWLPSGEVAYIKDYKEVCVVNLDSSRAAQRSDSAIRAQDQRCQAIANYGDYTTTGGTVKARVAPNGGTIAIVYKKTSPNGSETKLFTIAIGTSSMQEVLAMPNQQDISAIAWSPMADRIAFAAQETTTGEGAGLTIFDLTTKEQTTLVPGGGGTTISQLDWVIREIDSEVTNTPLTPTQPKVVVNVKPVAISALIPGGVTTSLPLSLVDQDVVFMPTLTNNTDPAKLRAVKKTGGEVRDYLALPDPTAVWSFDGVSPDGQLLAFHKVLALDATQVIQENWVSRADGSDLKMVSRQVIGSNETGYSLSWKSDSTGFYYVMPAFADKPAQICSQDAAGSSKQCVDIKDDGNNIKNATKLQYSLAKDGTSFVLGIHDTQTNQSRIYKVDVSTGNTTLLKHLPATKISGISWSPDGTQFGVIMQGQAGTGIFTFSPDAAAMTQASGTAEPFVWVAE